MSFFIFVDGNDLLASQLNGNFGNTIDATSATPQSIVAALTTAGLTTTALTASGASIFGSAESHKITTVTASGTYVVQTTDFTIYINKTVAGTSAITLPSAPSTNRWLIIKDKKGDCATNPVTISGAQLIDGQASLALSNNYASVCLQYDGTGWSIW